MKKCKDCPWNEDLLCDRFGKLLSPDDVCCEEGEKIMNHSGCAGPTEESAITSSLEEKTIDLIRKIYKNDCAGGALHIVLDDGNIEDENIFWCIANSIPEADKEFRHLYLQCAYYLLEMPEGKRFWCINMAVR